MKASLSELIKKNVFLTLTTHLMYIAESALGSSYRQLVRARFTRSFLAQLIGLRVHYKHFEQDDPGMISYTAIIYD